jgi:hypothetical protein
MVLMHRTGNSMLAYILRVVSILDQPHAYKVQNKEKKGRTLGRLRVGVRVIESRLTL